MQLHAPHIQPRPPLQRDHPRACVGVHAARSHASLLGEGRWVKPWINAKIGHVVAAGLEQLVKIDVSVDQAVKELDARVKGLVVFGERYRLGVPKVRVVSYFFVPSTD